MAWPFLTDILRRKLGCSGLSAEIPQSRALPMGHRSETGSALINTFPSAFSSLLVIFLLNSASDQHVRARLPFSPSKYLAVCITLPCLLFLVPPLSVFYNLSLSFFPIISINCPSFPSFPLSMSLIFHTCLSWF